MAESRWRRALPLRLATLAAVALILWTVATAIVASLATDRIVAAIVAERAVRARAIAARVEQVLRADLQTLDRIAAAAHGTSSPDTLTSLVRGIRLADSVVRIAPDGTVLWSRAVRDGAVMHGDVARVEPPAAGRWRAEGSTVMQTSRGQRAFLVLPARESDAAGGSIAAAIDPSATALQELFASYADEPYRVALVDNRGEAIAASSPRPAERDLLTAAAPVLNGSWQIQVVQSRARALAPILGLRRVLVSSSLLLLAFAVFIARAAATSIRRPVLGMITVAERLAHGDHAEPIPSAGEDEIGRLAAALEKLRKTLERDERRGLLLKRVMSAQEEERRRIARELHDRTAQQLSALTMQLETVARGHPETRDDLARPHALAQAAIDDLHEVIYGLRPAMLDDLGLLPAIRAYADQHLRTRGLQVLYEFPAIIPPVAPEAATMLYRIVQEAITNVERHAEAEAVMIACTATPTSIMLEIEDDGVGFDPAQVSRPRASGQGLGLLGMRERLALLDGALSIESEPGRGTRVMATLPLASATECAA